MMDRPCPTVHDPYTLLFNALSLIPLWHYLFAFFLACATLLYNFLEFHLIRDSFFWFRGCPIGLTYHPSSEIYRNVVSKCRILHGRYLATPWLSSPHFQTCFLNFLGRPPVFSYRRQIFHASDGGTIALDWLLNSDVSGGAFNVNNGISKDDTTPIVIVVPGLTSDSASPYLKHLAYNTAKCGWNVVVSNHRGLGGVSVTSDCFYNAGWTEDIRAITHYLHHQYPKAPLFAIGTSIGANVLVKYLGEDRELTPIAGAVAICNPWDLLICDRFISRRLVQKLYDRALTIGLQGYAQLHEPRYTRLANWEGIKKSRSVRDFDHHATCLVGKFETVDTYYRRCSSSSYIGNVTVPLLCISALDDPLCTREAIPWDECRANQNVVLATAQHGGHLAFFEGLAGNCLWWVRAVDEFLMVLHASPCMHVQKTCVNSPVESSIDHGPYVNVAEDGMVAAAGNEHTSDMVEDSKEMRMQYQKNTDEVLPTNPHTNLKPDFESQNSQNSEETTNNQNVMPPDATAQFRRSLYKISQQNRKLIWLLAFIAAMTGWPILGSALNFIFRKKRRNILFAASPK